MGHGQIWLWGEKARVFNDTWGLGELRNSMNEWHEPQKRQGRLQEKGAELSESSNEKRDH